MTVRPVGKQGVIIWEELRRDRKHAIHDEGSCEHINGIMHVREEHSDAEDDGGEDEKAAPEPLVPKNERHEVRKRGMP